MADKKRRKIPDASFFDIEKVASNTECTGLIPSLPQNDAEAEALAELYAVHKDKA